MSTFAPDSLKDIFKSKIPAGTDTGEGAVKATEKHMVSLEPIESPAH